ncbi:unnamed protein product [Toxocara canis]|uniref:KHDC4/BBP-like KH-domain type I domain-containing protein n=1 Tax=Toxocara canis TaxID=6265 RepID=A0A3P7F6M0_TOXCA|nr:unnamed protein product [Toxocara canis]
MIPNFRHPHFNFVGKILGPKGASLQAMAKQFKCHIYVLGRGSTKDRAKEQELLNSGDLQYAHYGGPLHVKIETIAPAHVAYKRVAGVLEALSSTLQPVNFVWLSGFSFIYCWTSVLRAFYLHDGANVEEKYVKLNGIRRFGADLNGIA